MSPFHAITDDNSSLGIPWTLNIFINGHVHLSFGLISSHMPENSWTYGAFSPFFTTNHQQKTSFMKFMWTPKHKNIVFKFLGALLFNGFDYKLLKTNHAFLVFHLDLSKCKFDGVKVWYFKHIVIFFFLELILFIDFFHDIGDGLEQRVLTGEFILVVQIHRHLFMIYLLHPKPLLLFFHTYIKIKPI